MTNAATLERLLQELSAPRRNHYFYGKLMDVCHFEMEQTYVNHKRWLLNQHALGAGVLCGLNVAAKDDQLWVEPGMAIDGYGREIIKPVRTAIDPWKITDACGKTPSDLSKETRHVVTLLLCYRECLTDYMPVLVSDCGADQDASASTLVETFQLAIREGAPAHPSPVLDSRCCKTLSSDPSEKPSPGSEPSKSEDAATRARIIEAMRQRLCECASGPCTTPAEPCVVLAVVELLPGGRIGEIQQCRYRQRIYSNQVLLELILCLAARLDECCGKDEAPDAPPKVAAVEVLNTGGDAIANLSVPSPALLLKPEQLMRSLRVTFTRPVDPRTVVAGSAGADPKAQSFLVMERERGLVSGTLTFENDRTVRWHYVQDALPVGRYVVQLQGEPDANAGRPAIASPDGLRLDGEPVGLPSGDGVEGGAFRFRLNIAEDATAEEPPKVNEVFVLSNQNAVLAYITDPREVPAIDVALQPASIRITFTDAIDPQSVVASAPDPRMVNFRVTQGTSPVAGTLAIEGPTQMRWSTTSATGTLLQGTFMVQLFGDADAGAGRTAITGANGLRLDGEPRGELPSGDDIEGGEFQTSFRVVPHTTGEGR